ncbi:hypothetical protein [Ornatilinea apprima]|nr:hypothetical protein [Ornatilinea apprima]
MEKDQVDWVLPEDGGLRVGMFLIFGGANHLTSCGSSAKIRITETQEL